MYLDPKYNSIPLLQRSTTSSEDPLSVPPNPIESEARESNVRPRSGVIGFISRLWGWPIIVISCQLWLQTVTWGFVAVLSSRGVIFLPHVSAVWVANHPRPVTLISTLMSTVFAAGSSHLFSVGLRRAIASSLTQPMTLGALSSTISLASRGLILTRRRWKWSGFHCRNPLNRNSNIRLDHFDPSCSRCA
ncbi:hypothetical protein B0H14DRAFT_1415423 [Mycena olivaceomarginata]|nr:hypothetical protein B0H14DRAFT_1415423 [Mycena olivaceomarginata]